MLTVKTDKIIFETDDIPNSNNTFTITNPLTRTEIKAHEFFAVRFTDGTVISSSDFNVAVIEHSDTDAVLKFEKSDVSVLLKLWVHGNTLKKQLTVTQTDEKKIDFIDLETFDTNGNEYFDVNVVEGGEIPAFHSVLGQPVYINAMFVGCEFPATENRVIDSKVTVRYYLGKNVGENFICPVTVTGTSDGISFTEVKRAFYEYIDQISVQIDLRFQYNSWYDYMRNIDENNILTSFKQVHDRLTSLDAPDMSAYVVDDGWVDMKASFWSYNKKFPNGMTKVSSFCRELDSTFGMWLGPRGGYNDVYKFAKRFHRAKNGYINRQAKDICVASTDYINKLQKFLIDQTRLYDISYWKFDGFALKPCRSKKHDHMVGGYENMYYVTDLWTKWISLYKALRKTKQDLWINMTCYVNVSPWWLQWVNSIWIQNSGDIGFAKNCKNQPQVEAEITYRDGRYFDCLIHRTLQMPLKGIYNHEPIYGNEANVKYTDEEFEKYLYWCTVRGQALNELHLSPSMMSDKKWEILSSVMNFQKDNYRIFKHAEFFGGDPIKNEIYGFSSWDNGEGIIAIRNPSDANVKFELTLDTAISAPKSLKAEQVTVICGESEINQSQSIYGYGDKIEISLKPFGTLIFKLN